MAKIIKPINEMNNDELWSWWLDLSDKWKWLFLKKGLGLNLWKSKVEYFDEGDKYWGEEGYNYVADFDWCDWDLTFAHIKHLPQLTALNLSAFYDENLGLHKAIIDTGAGDNLLPLSYFTQLETLILDNNSIGDISALSNLTQLTILELKSTHWIRDLSPLSNLTKLTTLKLGYNRIENLSALSKLPQLVELELDKNEIVDISPLSDLKNLSHLTLRENKISDMSALQNLSSLTNLDIGQFKLQNDIFMLYHKK